MYSIKLIEIANDRQIVNYTFVFIFSPSKP